MANRLAREKSPYLLQHKDNPVDWYPWCDEAFEKAVREDKPIFLSIGYSTCHWCHVMARESFEDEQVAALLNYFFVPVKVDREERPDVDAVYMSVCQTMHGSGGWPLTIIMTPDQEPFLAGTYFPKENRYGQTGLLHILKQAAALWRNDRRGLLEYTDKVMEKVAAESAAEGAEPTRELLQKARSQFDMRYDPKWGGFSPMMKFPMPHILMFLMEYSRREEDPAALEMAERTLNAIDRGGIHDQIGGGFSRYSTDEMWMIPHFEKMLYDNALLILAYLDAYTLTKKERYAIVARRTADYILRELAGPEGGFACGQDADSDGVEGKYYAFTPEEIREVLGEADGAEFCHLYNVVPGGNFEGKTIPNRIGRAEAGWGYSDPRLRKLYNYRLGRTKLHRDDKILLSWNGWAIAAFARAGRVLGEQRYLDAAVQTQAFIESHMTDGNNRLYVRWRDGEAAHAGQLEDYGVYALGLLELYTATSRAEYLDAALLRARQMRELFADEKRGGYYLTASDGERLIVRPKETYDGASPSGNSVAAMVLQSLADLTGEPEWMDAAWRQLVFLAGEFGDDSTGHGYALLAMCRALYGRREFVCDGDVCKMPADGTEGLETDK